MCHRTRNDDHSRHETCTSIARLNFHSQRVIKKSECHAAHQRQKQAKKNNEGSANRVRRSAGNERFYATTLRMESRNERALNLDGKSNFPPTVFILCRTVG